MSNDLLAIEIPELVVPGHRLGRHVLHDPKSKNFLARRCETRVSTIHNRLIGPFDQGDVGSCTGNAIAGLLMTDPFRLENRLLDEQGAREFYALATRLQGGTAWPEDGDPGSSGLMVAKAAVDAGYIAGFDTALGLDHALDALVEAPEIIGINWYDSMDEPDANAMISISPNAVVRGGHEVELLAVNFEDYFVTLMNSWGPGWGHNGLASMSFDTFGRLLGENGDVTTIRLAA